jgi:hypothetical protein
MAPKRRPPPDRGSARCTGEHHPVAPAFFRLVEGGVRRLDDRVDGLDLKWSRSNIRTPKALSPRTARAYSSCKRPVPNRRLYASASGSTAASRSRRSCASALFTARPRSASSCSSRSSAPSANPAADASSTAPSGTPLNETGATMVSRAARPRRSESTTISPRDASRSRREIRVIELAGATMSDGAPTRPATSSEAAGATALAAAPAWAGAHPGSPWRSASAWSCVAPSRPRVTRRCHATRGAWSEPVPRRAATMARCAGKGVVAHAVAPFGTVWAAGAGARLARPAAGLAHGVEGSGRSRDCWALAQAVIPSRRRRPVARRSCR